MIIGLISFSICRIRLILTNTHPIVVRLLSLLSLLYLRVAQSGTKLPFEVKPKYIFSSNPKHHIYQHAKVTNTYPTKSSQASSQ